MMDENIDFEALKQKVVELEKKLLEYEQKGAEKHLREMARRFEKIAEMGEDESKRVCTEMEVLTAKGLKKDAEVCITISKVEEGRMKTYAYLRDITEQKRMAREIREATKRFEKIDEMGEGGIIVFDEDSRIEFANQVAAEILGIPKDQILGREFFSLIGKRDEEFLEEMVMRGE